MCGHRLITWPLLLVLCFFFGFVFNSPDIPELPKVLGLDTFPTVSAVKRLTAKINYSEILGSATEKVSPKRLANSSQQATQHDAKRYVTLADNRQNPVMAKITTDSQAKTALHSSLPYYYFRPV